jgi:hypothetical protein
MPKSHLLFSSPSSSEGHPSSGFISLSQVDYQLTLPIAMECFALFAEFIVP